MTDDVYLKHHTGRVFFSQKPGTTIQVWSYPKGKGREFHIAFIGPDTHTICQGVFAVMPRRKKR
jgi:hypothetical protein